MKHLSDVLREADPVKAEPEPDAAARQARRRTLLAAMTTPEARGRRSFMLSLATAAGVVAVLAGVVYWPRAVADVIAAVRFEVRLAETQPTAGFHEAVIAGTDRKIYLAPDVAVTNADIASARVVPGGAEGQFGVAVAFTPDGGAKMAKLTAAHLDHPLAILLDGQVVMAPVIRAPITQSAVITGTFTKAECERIAAGLIGR